MDNMWALRGGNFQEMIFTARFGGTQMSRRLADESATPLLPPLMPGIRLNSSQIHLSSPKKTHR